MVEERRAHATVDADEHLCAAEEVRTARTDMYVHIRPALDQ